MWITVLDLHRHLPMCYVSPKCRPPLGAFTLSIPLPFAAGWTAREDLEMVTIHRRYPYPQSTGRARPMRGDRRGVGCSCSLPFPSPPKAFRDRPPAIFVQGQACGNDPCPLIAGGGLAGGSVWFWLSFLRKQKSSKKDLTSRAYRFPSTSIFSIDIRSSSVKRHRFD